MPIQPTKQDALTTRPVFIELTKRLPPVKLSDIAVIKSANGYAIIHFTNGKETAIFKAISKFDQTVFVRVSHQTLLPKKAIRSVIVLPLPDKAGRYRVEVQTIRYETYAVSFRKTTDVLTQLGTSVEAVRATKKGVLTLIP